MGVLIAAIIAWSFSLLPSKKEGSKRPGAKAGHREDSVQVAPQVAPQVAQVSPQAPQLPPALASELQAAMGKLLANLDGARNHDGLAWEQKARSSSTEAYCSPLAGSTRLIFKVRAVASVPARFQTADVREHICDWRRRMVWDGKTIQEGRLCVQFADMTDLAIYSSAPALGGSVSSREWLDFRRFRMLPENEGGGFIMALLSVDPKALPATLQPRFKDGCVRAKSHPGGGLRARPCGPAAEGRRPWEVVLVVNVELGGWLPVKLINQATTLGIMGTSHDLLSYFQGL